MSVKRTATSRTGRSGLGERLFEAVATGLIVLLACGWVGAIAMTPATGDKVNTLAPAAVRMGTDGDSDRPAPVYVAGASDGIATIGRDDTGESGKLRAVIRGASEEPRIVTAVVALQGALRRITDFSVITPRPASELRKGKLGQYYVGKWPRATSAKGGDVEYRPPSGFIEVTPANERTRLSEHFELRDFLTHGQGSVWPKYVVVNLKLVDKLELVLEDLRAHGVNPEGVRVMSGFRTPAYNRTGGDPRGRASLSRHMYGDAADIYIDNHGTGRMSDLNHDGRVNSRDARVILASVDRVERAHPSLVGGCGVYVGNGSHGPFVHIDARGYPARWTGTGD